MVGTAPNQKQVIVIIDEEERKKAKRPSKSVGPYFQLSSGFHVYMLADIGYFLSSAISHTLLPFHIILRLSHNDPVSSGGAFLALMF